MTFKEFINETIENLFTHSDKEKYADEVWKLLTDSYKSIGGIKGSGFQSKQDMMEKIKMWKLFIRNDEIIAGLMYKDRGMRKTVAIFTNGSSDGKKELEKFLRADFERSSIEVSHSLLKFVERKMPDLVKKFVIPSKEVENILHKKIKIVDDHHYERDINGTVVRKMMLGNIKKFYKV